MLYNNISYYKSYRTKLLILSYPNEGLSTIGEIIFKDKSLKGIKLRLWKDKIIIKFNSQHQKKIDLILSSIQDISSYLDDFFEIEVYKYAVKINPLNKNKFPDSILGMKQRAAYFVLISNLCINCFRLDKENQSSFYQSIEASPLLTSLSIFRIKP